MKKPILITLLCAVLMLVTPLTGVAQENTVSNNLPEQPKDVEGLIVQIRTVVDEILQRYGHIPMVRSLCNIILKTMDSFNLLLFCIFIVVITIPVFIIVFFVWSTFGIIPPTLGPILFLLAMILDSECPQSNTLNNLLPSFKSLYPMLETNDNINTFDGCPCLQE